MIYQGLDNLVAYDEGILLARQYQGCTRLWRGAEGRFGRSTKQNMAVRVQWNLLMDTIYQYGRATNTRRPIRRQTVALCTRTIVVGSGTTIVEKMDIPV